MTVFSAKQVFPVDYEETEVSQRLLEASHSGDLSLAFRCIVDPSVDVNFAGAVTLKTASTDLLLLPESPSQLRLDFQEFVSDVSPLFLAVHADHAALVKKLLVINNAVVAVARLAIRAFGFKRGMPATFSFKHSD